MRAAAGCSPSPSVWAETPPGMETTLTAMLFSGGRARGWLQRLRQITEDHAIGNLVADVGLLAPVSNGTWTADRTVRPVWACGTCRPATATCYALDELSPVAEDRPHRNVLTLRASSADAPAS